MVSLSFRLHFCWRWLHHVTIRRTGRWELYPHCRACSYILLPYTVSLLCCCRRCLSRASLQLFCLLASYTLLIGGWRDGTTCLTLPGQHLRLCLAPLTRTLLFACCPSWWRKTCCFTLFATLPDMALAASISARALFPSACVRQWCDITHAYNLFCICPDMI